MSETPLKDLGNKIENALLKFSERQAVKEAHGVARFDSRPQRADHTTNIQLTYSGSFVIITMYLATLVLTAPLATNVLPAAALPPNNSNAPLSNQAPLGLNQQPSIVRPGGRLNSPHTTTLAPQGLTANPGGPVHHKAPPVRTVPSF